jgi:hypothetical protein
MHLAVRAGVLLLVCCGSLTIAIAQSGPIVEVPQPLRLSPAQKSVILQAVREDAVVAEPARSLRASVGTQLPDSIPLYPLPDALLFEMPEFEEYRYAISRKQVLIVEPVTMRVVEVIRR